MAGVAGATPTLPVPHQHFAFLVSIAGHSNNTSDYVLAPTIHLDPPTMIVSLRYFIVRY